MTRAALKTLIEPTQDGARLTRTVMTGCGDCDPCIGGRPDQCAVGATAIDLAPTDPLMAYIESAIDGAENISDVASLLEYAAEQLKRASKAIVDLEYDEVITDTPLSESVGDGKSQPQPE